MKEKEHSNWFEDTKGTQRFYNYIVKEKFKYCRNFNFNSRAILTSYDNSLSVCVKNQFQFILCNPDEFMSKSI